MTSKCSIVFVTFILLSTIFFQFPFPSAVAEETDEKTASERALEQIGVFLANNVYSFFSFGAPALVADPTYIEIGYNESVSFDIGLIDLKSEEFKDDPLQKIMSSESLTFDILQYPSDNVDNKWRIVFDPPEVNFEEGNKRKTTATLSLSSPPVGGEPIQSGELVVQINRNRAYKDLWHYGFMWFLFAFIGGWGKLSGQVDIGTPTVSLLVKVKPYHEVIIEVPELLELQPNQIETLPIDITNLGNYKDIISFRIISEHEGIILSDPIDTTLQPGETKQTLLGIGVDPTLIDTGTIHEVEIKAYSLNNPNETLTSRTVLLETRGFYVSEGNMAGFIAPFLLLVLLIIFILFRRKKNIEKIARKPEKPWILPQEKKYLEKLKEKDKEQYQKMMQQMKDEYQSALLWYNHYVKAIKAKKRKNENGFIQNITIVVSNIKKRFISLVSQVKKKVTSSVKSKPEEKTEKEEKSEKEPIKDQKKPVKKLSLPKIPKPTFHRSKEKKKEKVPEKREESKQLKTEKKQKTQPPQKPKRKTTASSKKQQLLNKIKKQQKKQQKKVRGA
ncbi:MAG: hypothetical protein R6U21_02980 [Thermoplasmatota archaeon]